jgi:hypothetical protein
MKKENWENQKEFNSPSEYWEWEEKLCDKYFPNFIKLEQYIINMFPDVYSVNIYFDGLENTMDLTIPIRCKIKQKEHIESIVIQKFPNLKLGIDYSKLNLPKKELTIKLMNDDFSEKEKELIAEENLKDLDVQINFATYEDDEKGFALVKHISNATSYSSEEVENIFKTFANDVLDLKKDL